MTTDTMQDKINALSPREKRLLLIMGIIMPVLVMAVIIGLFNRSLTKVQDQTRAYQKSLDLLAATASYYRESQVSQDDGGIPALFTEEVLTKNPVKLTGFLAARASEAGVSPSSYDTEDIPLGSSSANKGQPIVTEKKISIDIRDTQVDDLLKFLRVIETSGEPVVIKRIDLRGNARTPGQVRARVEVSTYIKQKQES